MRYYKINCTKGASAKGINTAGIIFAVLILVAPITLRPTSIITTDPVMETYESVSAGMEENRKYPPTEMSP